MTGTSSDCINGIILKKSEQSSALHILFTHVVLKNNCFKCMKSQNNDVSTQYDIKKRDWEKCTTPLLNIRAKGMWSIKALHCLTLNIFSCTLLLHGNGNGTEEMAEWKYIHIYSIFFFLWYDLLYIKIQKEI